MRATFRRNRAKCDAMNCDLFYKLARLDLPLIQASKKGTQVAVSNCLNGFDRADNMWALIGLGEQFCAF